MGVGGCLLFMLACFAGLFYALSSYRVPFGVAEYVALFVSGALFSGCVVGVWHMAAAATGATYWFTGSEAEQWTGKELKKLGPEWQIFHGVPFSAGSGPVQRQVDVDHIAVGPGGVLVLETKYHSSALDLAAAHLDYQLRQDAEQTTRNAQRVRNLLRGVVPEVPVVPVLVYWGRLVVSPPGHVRQLGPLQVVHGRKAKQWLPLVIGTQRDIDPGSLRSAVARLEAKSRLPFG